MQKKEYDYQEDQRKRHGQREVVKRKNEKDRKNCRWKINGEKKMSKNKIKRKRGREKFQKQENSNGKR